MIYNNHDNHIYVCTHIHMYLSLSLYIYIYIYTHTHTRIYLGFVGASDLGQTSRRDV